MTEAERQLTSETPSPSGSPRRGGDWELSMWVGRPV